jgi:hypothetical protein
MEFEELESGGDAGAVVEESAGALGDVDCCFEQATIASALMHNKRRLRFIDHLCISVYLAYQASPAHLALPGGTQRLDASSVPSQHCFPPVSSRLRPLHRPLICFEPSRCSWGK